MELSTRPTGARRAFTLVELLTVIVILGILAGLISAAVVAAVGKAKRARVTLEINSMDQALKIFKEKYGDFPPDNISGARSAEVEAFLRRAFPRYEVNSGDTPYTQFLNDISQYGLNAGSDSATLLVFWLGGVPDPNKSGWVPDGFSLDPQHPFVNRNHALGQQRTEPLFEFKPERVLRFGSANYRYYPEISGASPSSSTVGCPYVYFRASSNGYLSWPQTIGTQSVAPYLRTASNLSNSATYQWYNPSTFQIISAGMDNLYGVPPGNLPPMFPGNITAEHYDNLTNFAEGKLEDVTP